MLFPEEIVLNKCERITSEDKGPEPFVLSWIFSVTAIFIDDAMSFQRAVFEQHFEETEKAGKRISELNRIFKRIYEDDISGAISHERFLKLSDEYEAERKELTDFVKAEQTTVDTYEQDKANFGSFASVIRKDVGIKELTPTIVNAPDKSSGHRRQKVEIVWNFIGNLDDKQTAIRQESRAA